MLLSVDDVGGIDAGVDLAGRNGWRSDDPNRARAGEAARRLAQDMTKAQWERAGVTREVGVYTFVVKKNGFITIYRPGDYRSGCSACTEDFTTTFRPNGGRLTLGSVSVCSFEGVYSWQLTGRTLIVAPVADKRCVVRATFSAVAGSADACRFLGPRSVDARRIREVRLILNTRRAVAHSVRLPGSRIPRRFAPSPAPCPECPLTRMIVSA